MASHRFPADEGQAFARSVSDRVDLLKYTKGSTRVGVDDDDEEYTFFRGGRSATDKNRSCFHRCRAVIGVLAVLVVATAISLGIALGTSTSKKSPSITASLPVQPTTIPGTSCGAVAVERRVHCAPHTTVNKTSCESLGCCWDATRVGHGDKLGIPACFFPANFGYRVQDRRSVPGAPWGQRFVLQRPAVQSLFPDPVMQLNVDILSETPNRLRVRITDTQRPRYEVPITNYSPVKSTPSTTNYDWTATERGWTFSMAIRRSATGRKIFDTAIGGLIYTNQFLQITSTLPSQYIYGLGEHLDDMLHSTNWTKLTLFSRDIPPDETVFNLYGVHPFYLCVEPDGNTHGVLLLNSNAMDIILQPTPAITYRTIGGILDFFIFLGPRPDQVIQQYTEVIGRPFFPPYWALGFHLCRWGYNSSAHTKEIVETMRQHGIPQDTQWNDIDYMSDYLDFTYNKTAYAGLPDLVEDLHKHRQRYVMIIDPGIHNQSSYFAYLEGLRRGIFINDTNDEPLIGKVWPGTTAFPDFTNPAAHGYWEDMLRNYHNTQNVQFDGIWIDMNEPSNFFEGSISGCPESSYNTPPYQPDVVGDKLYSKTLCMTGKQYASLHYNVHSLYGHTEAIATMKAVRSITGKRGLVISRSTYPGSGNHTGHWLGDNRSQWGDMRHSIPGILDFSFFAIPLVGADICGFREDAPEELCTRWMQLGAFYPFSRNHNELTASPQEPTAARFSEVHLNVSRDALLLRYQLLPYLYTLFYKAHTTGFTVARPLFFEFPTDVKTLSNDRQFLWGSDLLISPVLEKDATSVSAYFPAGHWYDIRTGAVLGNNSNGGNVLLDAPIDIIPVHVRGGAIIPTQTPNTTTNTSRSNPFGLIVAVDANGQASGQLFLDDGESIDTISGRHFSLINYTYTPGKLSSQVLHPNYKAADSLYLGSITLFGTDFTENVTLALNGRHLDSGYSYEFMHKVLHISLPNIEDRRQVMNNPLTLTIANKLSD